MLLAGVLSAGSLTFACAAPAYADEVSDAQNALSAAEARMSQIASEHEALVKQAEELQQQIHEVKDMYRKLNTLSPEQGGRHG